MVNVRKDMKITMRLSKKIMLCVLAITFSLLFYSPKAMALSDAILKQRILSRAAQTSMLNSTRVQVDVKNGAVILSGTVLLYAHKMKYECITWQTYGIVDVDNKVMVVPKYKVADSIIERKINEVLETFRRQYTSEVTARVTNGKILLQGIFAHPRIVFFLKREVADIEGVIAIEIHVSIVV